MASGSRKTPSRLWQADCGTPPAGPPGVWGRHQRGFSTRTGRCWRGDGPHRATQQANQVPNCGSVNINWSRRPFSPDGPLASAAFDHHPAGGSPTQGAALRRSSSMNNRSSASPFAPDGECFGFGRAGTGPCGFGRSVTAPRAAGQRGHATARRRVRPDGGRWLQGLRDGSVRLGRPTQSPWFASWRRCTLVTSVAFRRTGPGSLPPQQTRMSGYRQADSGAALRTQQADADRVGSGLVARRADPGFGAWGPHRPACGKPHAGTRAADPPGT